MPSSNPPQPDEPHVRLAELIAALSLATNLGTARPLEHAMSGPLRGGRQPAGEPDGLHQSTLSGMVYVDAAGLAGYRELALWVERGAEYVRTKPRQPKRSSRLRAAGSI